VEFRRGDLVLVRHPVFMTGEFILVPSIIIDVTSSRAASNFSKVTVYNIPGCRINTTYNSHIKLLVPHSDPKTDPSGIK
jgi:hypothetical protein